MESKKVIFFFLFIISLVVLIANVMFGSVSISIQDIFSVFMGGKEESSFAHIIVMRSRFPTALVAWLAGAALSVSGLQMQTLFRNPVAGPYILGISSGASLGVAILFLAGVSLHATYISSGVATLVAAAAGSMLVFLLILLISWRVSDITILLVIGLMIGGTISAVISILQSTSSKEGLQMFVFWTFGSFQIVDYRNLIILSPALCLGFFIAVTQVKPLNVLQLGDTSAKNLGVSVKKTKFWNIAGTCILAGSVTAFCGPVAFIGLAVPHLARILFQTSDHRILIPASILIGAIVGGACNFLATAPWSENTYPLNAVTSLMGAPFVVWILFRIRKIKVYG